MSSNTKTKENKSSTKKTENITEFLSRVTNTPQILQTLVNTSLPYLLISPHKKKLDNKKSGVNKAGVKMDVKKKITKGNVNSKQAKTTTGLTSSSTVKTKTTKNVSDKPKSGVVKTSTTRATKKGDKVSLSKRKSAALSLPSFKNISYINMNMDNIGKELSEMLSSSDLKKEQSSLRNSSLFSITEKSYLSINNYAPVDVDTLLLQKLIILDQLMARKLIYTILNIENKQNTKEIVEDDSKEKPTKKNKIKLIKKNVVNQIYNLLLARIRSNKERPAEILFNVVSQLCKKSRISSNNKMKRIRSINSGTNPEEAKRKIFIDSLNIPKEKLQLKPIIEGNRKSQKQTQ
ncbi:uncharacterized protein [Rhodnius prolixus]|uniref:Uncharacterized protein n=1 Tax=Rhodnius prolixus TaxID=13249 RepID=T1HP62_RHOPR